MKISFHAIFLYLAIKYLCKIVFLFNMHNEETVLLFEFVRLLVFHRRSRADDFFCLKIYCKRQILASRA